MFVTLTLQPQSLSLPVHFLGHKSSDRFQYMLRDFSYRPAAIRRAHIELLIGEASQLPDEATELFICLPDKVRNMEMRIVAFYAAASTDEIAMVRCVVPYPHPQYIFDREIALRRRLVQVFELDALKSMCHGFLLGLAQSPDQISDLCSWHVAVPLLRSLLETATTRKVLGKVTERRAGLMSERFPPPIQ